VAKEMKATMADTMRINALRIVTSWSKIPQNLWRYAFGRDTLPDFN
jgi:hypothetical protein